MAVNTIFLVRGNTAANWEANNPILRNREVAYDKTAGRLKIGDGTTAWNNLPYVKPDVINDLVTGGRDNALSAEMGVALKAQIDEKADDAKVLYKKHTVDRLDVASTQFPLSAQQGMVLKGLIDQKADITTVNNLETKLTNLINQKADITTVNNLKTELTNLITTNKVEIVDSLASTTAYRTKALSAYQGYYLNYWKINYVQDIDEESWTFTLEDGSTVTKKVALWTATGSARLPARRS